ncbi:MAG: tryptophan-rich sensory protein [Halothece sp. Uz-M2-17]|nr:tryptophan-rich sensory protein [Halothece sp. Uz-M2-17]
MQVNQQIVRQVANAIAIVAAFGVNVLANVRPIGGLTLGEISNQLFANVLITPARYAFAIWGLIYLGLFSFAIYQALPSQREKPVFERISYWLVTASVIQIGWIFVFQSRGFAWSFLLMVLILLSLLRVYSQLKVNRRRISRRERWCVEIPISIYFAWISVATVVNGAVALTAGGWSGWGISPEVWTVMMMIIAGAIALIINILKQDLAFTGVFIWALIAIALRHRDLLPIFITGIVLALILGASITWNLYQQRRQKPLP